MVIITALNMTGLNKEVRMNFLSIIKTVAPWIGTALGGPLGGMAVEAACSALGLSEKTESSLKNALSGATSEQILALKNADHEFSLRMQELGYDQIKDLEKIAMEDRKDARNLLVQIRSWVPAVLSVLITLGYFGVLGAMLAGVTKDLNQQVLNIMLGSLTTAWASVLAFWFGTTAGSGQKTEMIAKSMPIEPGK